MGKHYRRKAARQQRRGATKVLGVAAVAGAALGLASVELEDGDMDRVLAAAKPMAVSAGIVRARAPQAGDYWHVCDEARAAGSAPIFAGEPGYRDGLDGDSDGVACEPYRGMP